MSVTWGTNVWGPQPQGGGWGLGHTDFGLASGTNASGQWSPFQPGATYGSPGSPQYTFNGATGPGGAQGFGSWSPIGQQDSRGNGMPAGPSPSVPKPPGQSGSGVNIQTSVKPQSVFGSNDTRTAQNMAYAQGSMPMPWLLQQFARPGMSTDSPGMVSQALPKVAQSRLGGWEQYNTIPFQDDYANAQSIFKGQMGRENEALGLAGALSNVNASDRRFQAQNASSIMNLLGSFMGSSGGMGGFG